MLIFIYNVMLQYSYINVYAIIIPKKGVYIKIKNCIFYQ